MSLLNKTKSLFSSAKSSLINHPLTTHFFNMNNNLHLKHGMPGQGEFYGGPQAYNDATGNKSGGAFSALYDKNHKSPVLNRDLNDVVNGFRQKYFPGNIPRLEAHPNFVPNPNDLSMSMSPEQSLKPKPKPGG